MSKFFTAERFGRPQFLAAMLLLAFVGQCLWLISRQAQTVEIESTQIFRVQEGLRQWQGLSVAGTPANERLEGSAPLPLELEQNQGYDPNHSPLWYLLSSAPLLAWPGSWQDNVDRYWGWMTRIPYVVFGVLLGASLWYVSRRLYGNAGGYIALVLYCFSPTVIRSSTLWSAEPEMGAAWGAFGAVFTAIAVAHTLYAPREVVLWNWRRILLLGLSLALAIGCQFSLALLIPIALAFMLYVAPTRRLAALAIWVAACIVAVFLLFAAYAFHPGPMVRGLHHAAFWDVTWQAFRMPGAYLRVLTQIAQSGPAALAMIPVALVTYAVWPRARYFGNTAPLLVAAAFLLLAVGSPHYPGFGFQLAALPFLLVFVSGLCADLLETSERMPVTAGIWGLLIAQAFWNLLGLFRIPQS